VQYFGIFVTIPIVYNVAKLKQKQQTFVKFDNSFVNVLQINTKEGKFDYVNNNQPPQGGTQ
jgi:hypothetical protein